MKLGNYISETRTRRGEIAKAAGVSEVTIHRYINGKRIPRPEVMVRIVSATNGAVGPADFYPPPDPPK